jgi:hypothetical protein
MDAATRLRYEGFSQTPPLWGEETVSPFPQIKLVGSSPSGNVPVVFKNHRLGKLVEEFAFHQLKDQDGITWIADNLQIRDNRRTVGEIDALYYDHNVPVHLEVAYKFYLYDTLEDHDHPLAYWIGPNRKDNLFYKLSKLHGKQFPLLHNALTKPYLDRYELAGDGIEQRLCFRAQLFVPYQNGNVNFGDLNPDCVVGNYLSHQKLALFKGLKFHLPAKLDWLVAPHHAVEWIGYQSFADEINRYVLEERSPLVWVRHGEGDFRRWFVVFW